MRFRTGIVTAIKYRKKENKSTTQQASGFFFINIFIYYKSVKLYTSYL